MKSETGLGIGEMTLEEFGDRLRETPRQWRIYHGRKIRFYCRKSYPYGNCPIAVLTNSHTDHENPWKAGREKLGLSADLIRKIVDAVDGRSGYDPAIRAFLLNACGLAEGV